MDKFRLCVATLAAASLLTACNDENPWAGSDGEGRIAPKVAADPSVKDVAPRVRAAEDGFPVPDASDLRLSLKNADGSMTQSWESASLFPTDKLFKTGSYTLEASWGEPDAEGFECPYFFGTTDFVVKEDEVAEPSVTATLANTMVSVDYTQDFLNYFKTYTTQLHSAGGDFVTIIPGETRPAFLRPGEVTLTLNITKQNGVSATIEPARFQAQARHHYHLTLDVNGGETGDAQLVVNFDESIVTEDVVIDLSDDLMLSPEPRVTAHGFTPDVAMALVEGSAPAEAASFVITAMGGLQSVTLTTESPRLVAMGFPAEIDLMAATAAQQALLTQFGLDVKGLWRNPDKMASVDITNLLASIKGSGTHKFTIVAKDRLSKVNLPLTAVFTTEPVVLDITSAPGIMLGATEASVAVSYNGDKPEKNITVEALDSYGVWKQCALTSVSAAARSASTYNIRFAVPAVTDDLKIRVKYKGTVTDTATLPLSGVALVLKSDADVWATHASLAVNKKASLDYSAIKFYVSKAGGSYVAANAKVDPSTGMVTISGLEPGASYKVKASDTGAYVESYPSVEFSTESAAQPQNGNMDTWSQSAGWHKTEGGIGKETIHEYYPGSGVNDYWATRNSMTAGNWGYASCFYNAYSGTYGVANGGGQAAEICSVGWANTKSNTFTLLGGNCNQVSAGILFMGSYSYDHSSNKETITPGRPFTSRPASVQFDYKYAPVGGESWDVVVVVENRTGGKTTELARGTFTSAASVGTFTTHNVALVYSDKTLKATHAYVYFRSSTAASPAKENKKGSAGAFQGYSDSRYTGSVLTVDNIVFKY